MSDGQAVEFAENVKEARRFFMPRSQNPASKLPILAGAGVELCGSGYKVNRRDFAFCGIEFVSTGNGFLRLGTANYLLEPGVVFVYGGSTPQRIVAAPGAEMRKYFVDCVLSEDLLSLLSQKNMAPGTCFKIPRVTEAVAILDLIVDTGIAQGSASEAVCDALCLSFLEMISAIRDQAGGGNDKSFRRFKTCRDYLRENFLTIKTLEQAAHELGIAQSYLCRLFTRFEKLSPYRYLMDRKMRYAATCFRARKVSVAQLSEELGFPDQFQFSKAFKRSIGLSPSAFLSR